MQLLHLVTHLGALHFLLPPWCLNNSQADRWRALPVNNTLPPRDDVHVLLAAGREGGGPAGGSVRWAGEQEEVVGGGQENTGLLLLPVRQRSSGCSHLPVRALLWAANQNDGQLLVDGGERFEGTASIARRYLCLKEVTHSFYTNEKLQLCEYRLSLPGVCRDNHL